MARLTAGSDAGREFALRRFRHDYVSMAALTLLSIIAASCFIGEPILERLLGHGPNAPFVNATDINQRPVGPLTWVSDGNAGTSHTKTLLLLGADGPLGRDELQRLLAGGQVSLEIAFLATWIALLIGVFLGAVAGYYGGIADAVISRLTELVMSFPLLLLVIALGQTVADRFAAVTLGGIFEPGVLALSVVIGFFTWFYPARVSRTLIQSLCEQEFVEAAHMIGASNRRIIRQHLLPHLYGPMIVWGTLVAAGVIVLEASLSVLNFGVRLGTASWGSLLSQTWGTLLVFNPGVNDYGVPYPMPTLLKVWPSLALFVTVLCLTLVGDGLRSALDPRGEG